MNYSRTLKAAFVLTATIISLISCDQKHKISESEEEATYLLVGEPCSEGDYATAIRRADSLLNAPIQMSDSLRAYIMIDRDVSILEYGHPDWGMAYADTVIEFGKRHGIGLAVMQGLQNKGIISRRSGDWDTAISLYKEGLEIAVKENDEEMQQVFAEMLAIACAEHGLNDEAHSFGLKSLEMAREMQDTIQELNAVSTLSAILVKQGNYTEAIDMLRPYQEMSKSLKTVYQVKYLTPLLKSYLELNSLDKARQILRQTHEALAGMPINTQPYYVAINAEAILAEKEGRYNDEWHWLQLADSIGTMGTSPDALYLQRAKCLANLGRYKDAYDMQSKAIMALDSIRTADNDRRLSELMVKYDSPSKETAIAQLKTQRLIATLITILCLIGIVLLSVIIVNIRRRNRLRLERERREEYLKGLEHERKRIAGELHDDIAGSLVGLQLNLSSKLDRESEDMLIKLTRRVRTMSHELMPPEFSRKNFLEMLSDFVARFNHDDSSPDILLNETGNFRCDKLTPEESLELYRIVQESVNNAVTHGNGEEIAITLSGDDAWQLEITSGLPAEASESGDGEGIGLRSLRDRAAKIGASISADVSNGKFTIKLRKQNN